jgi:hypothetical protein
MDSGALLTALQAKQWDLHIRKSVCTEEMQLSKRRSLLTRSVLRGSEQSRVTRRTSSWV